MAQVIDWVAQQPWSTDKIGMVGCSWEGVMQLMAAAYQPRHLTCAVPQVTPLFANSVMTNGLAPIGFLRDWSTLRAGQDTQEPSAPVDGLQGAELFAQAQAEREALYFAPTDGSDPNARTIDMLIEEYRRGAPPPPFPELGPLRDLCDEFERINRSGVAVYMQAGWWDMPFSGETLDFFSALTGPKKLIMGPWNHGVLPTIEPLRWFDYWLKGIDNGIMDEPTIAYATREPKGHVSWKGAPTWPLKGSEIQKLHLSAAASGTIASAFDGTLTPTADEQPSEVHYPVDPEVSLGDCGRMRHMFRDVSIRHPDLVARGQRCATFTTAPLEHDLLLTGAPEIHVELRTTAKDGAVTATLEEVRPDGQVVYLTEAWVNLAHRKLGQCPRPHAGTAWRTQLGEDMLPVTPGEIMQLGLELIALSVKLQAGSRLRLTLAGADKGNLHVPVHDPVAVMTWCLGTSHLLLPVEARSPASLPHAFTPEDVGLAFADH